ncbi:Methionine aminopeptidase 1D, chloroplastic/mitochondrial [Vitis vinifera]|uniref:Methionine aminopeptidase 1D, chloroplastic/mitochondrial n=1 Tax=Vitis vinifera TaxID=29760 RepID=A0A438KJX1_VITVI|nr:Methionine aminopeptidase 1D, chloroplastic/mitochondrial [Vitis vinifera]
MIWRRLRFEPPHLLLFENTRGQTAGPVSRFSSSIGRFAGNNDGGHMVLNQTFTIEPMLTIGSINPIMWDDNWTVVTEDGSLSAQFEHTILITENGAEILTQC